MSQVDRVRKNDIQRKWRKENPEKVEEYKRKHYRYDPESTRDYQLRALYGITNSDYEAMLAAQGGTCAICGISKNKNGRKFAIDHDHKTGKIRGLLCVNCNAGIGNMKDDVDLLSRALAYLKKW